MDWKKILTELQDAGFSQKQIAETVGCSQPTISDLATGQQEDTRSRIGSAILAMHKLHCAATAGAAHL